jgi:hypothetical protein
MKRSKRTAHRRHTRRARRHTRKQRGGQYTGQWTGAYSFGGPVAPGSYGQTVVATSGCDAATPPGYISSFTPGGLPGMKGGRRRGRGSRRGSRRLKKQRGGRYTVDVGAGPIGGMAPITRIGCEGGLVNTAPPGAAPNPVPLQAGGAGPDNVAYYAPTAGYTNQSSPWVGSTGAPSLLQIPYAAREYNPACLKTA